MKPRFKWRHQYDQEQDEKLGEATQIICEDPSLTAQSFVEDADLNVLARRFGITTIPMGSFDPALFRDTTQDPDLRQVLDIKREAVEAFRGLPPKIRRRFHENPIELMEFLADNDNHEEAIRLGLINTPAAGAKSASTPGSTDTESQTDTAQTTDNANRPQKEPPQGTQKTSQKGT